MNHLGLSDLQNKLSEFEVRKPSLLVEIVEAFLLMLGIWAWIGIQLTIEQSAPSHQALASTVLVSADTPPEKAICSPSSNH